MILDSSKKPSGKTTLQGSSILPPNGSGLEFYGHGNEEEEGMNAHKRTDTELGPVDDNLDIDLDQHLDAQDKNKP